jgi:hypothetical protein
LADEGDALFPDRVTIPDPASDSPLGDPYAEVPGKTFFDDAELQNYIHAPHQKWNECNTDKVFPGGDQSPAPDQAPSHSSHTLLASAIEKSPAGIMMLAGRQDAIVIAEGTSLVLQNLTWNNVQGLQCVMYDLTLQYLTDSSPFLHQS